MLFPDEVLRVCSVNLFCLCVVCGLWKLTFSNFCLVLLKLHCKHFSGFTNKSDIKISDMDSAESLQIDIQFFCQRFAFRI